MTSTSSCEGGTVSSRRRQSFNNQSVESFFRVHSTVHEQPKKRNERTTRWLVVAYPPPKLSTPVCLVAGRRGADHTDDETNDVDLVVVVVVVVVVDRRLMVSATPAGRFGRFVSFRFVPPPQAGRGFLNFLLCVLVVGASCSRVLCARAKLDAGSDERTLC